jgi:predicted nuclease of predicted toxin-antitoxin system
MLLFKIDENLPVEVAGPLNSAGFDAATVVDEELGGKSDDVIAEFCRTEGRALITLDLGFADIRDFPPSQYAGLIVLRLHRADRAHILTVFQQLIMLLRSNELARKLWVVDESGVRIHD